MLNKHEVLTTEESNRLLLTPGRVTVNKDNWNIRLHDGETLGGFEIPTTRAYEPPLGPGPKELIAGSMEAGFFGEVSPGELFTYEDLASQIGLSDGTSQFNEESLWLKFALDNQILYVAKKTARYNVSWDQIQAVGAVHEGNSQVVAGPHLLDVTLLRGMISDPTPNQSGFDIVNSHGSEWNRLLYPVHSGIHDNTGNPSVHTDSTAEPFGSWASYSDRDLFMTLGSGRSSWTQEVSGENSGYRVHRGYLGITHVIRNTSSTSNTSLGWRPCLRLVV